MNNVHRNPRPDDYMVLKMNWVYMLASMSAGLVLLIGILIGVSIESGLLKTVLSKTVETNNASAATRHPTITAIAPITVKVTEHTTVLQDRQELRSPLTRGLYTLPDGTVVEVIAKIPMPSLGPRGAADDYGRPADYDATAACNEPDQPDGSYWRLLPNRQQRLANICRWHK